MSSVSFALLESLSLFARIRGGNISPGFFALLMIPLAVFFFLAAALNWRWIYFDRRYRWIRDAFGETGSRAMLAFIGMLCLIAGVIGAVAAIPKSSGGTSGDGAVAADSGDEYTNPEYGFAAKFPGAPKKENHNPITAYRYDGTFGGSFVVEVQPLPMSGIASHLLRDVVAPKYEELFIKTSEARNLIDLDLTPGVELIGDGTDGDGHTHMRVFIKNKKVYCVYAVGASRGPAKAFVESFRFTDSAPSGASSAAASSSPSKEDPPLTLDDLGDPAAPLPKLQLTSTKIDWLDGVNKAEEEPIKELAPKGGLLVGFVVTEGRYRQTTPVLGSMQPIFQKEGEYVLGERIGKGQGPAIKLLAEPGYAVGAINARRAMMIDGLQLVFMKVEAGHLDPTDRKESKWVGNTTGGSPCTIDPAGRFLVGVRCDLLDTGEVRSIEPAAVGDAPKPVAVKKDPEAASKDSAATSTASNESSREPIDPMSSAGVQAPHRVARAEREAEEAIQQEQSAGPPREDIAGTSKPVGNDRGTKYRDMAPEGSIMAGVQVSYNLWAGRDRYIGSIQPLYQTTDGTYAKGGVYGKEQEEKANAVAKQGYAVGAIAVRPGLKINAIQVVFMKVQGQRLDPNDSYTSEWFGTETGGKELLDGRGRPIIGIQGGHEEDLNGLQLIIGK